MEGNPDNILLINELDRSENRCLDRIAFCCGRDDR